MTSLMVFEEGGKINEYVGGYSDWSAKGGKLLAIGESISSGENKEKSSNQNITPTKESKGLSRTEQKELEQSLRLIEKLEITKSELEELLALPNFYDNPEIDVEDVLQRISDNQKDLESTYRQWERLEEMRQD